MTEPWKAHTWPCPLFYSGNWNKDDTKYGGVTCTCAAPRPALDAPASVPMAITPDMVEAAARTAFELPAVGDYTWQQMVTEDPSRAELWRDEARSVLEAAFEASERALVEDPRIDAIRSLLREFTNYPEPNWSITDHMFLDFEFWGRLTDILAPAVEKPTALAHIDHPEGERWAGCRACSNEEQAATAAREAKLNPDVPNAPMPGTTALAADPQSEVKEVPGWQWTCKLCHTTGIEFDQNTAEDVLEEHMEYHS